VARRCVRFQRLPGSLFHGPGDRVAPRSGKRPDKARVEIDINNEDNVLKPGMFVNVEVEFDGGKMPELCLSAP